MSTISQLKIDEHEFVTSDRKILAECESFYKELYISNENARGFEKYGSRKKRQGLTDIFGKNYPHC